MKGKVKTMKALKRILATCLALSVLMIFNVNSYADSVICPNSPDRYHHYDGHRSLNYGYSVPLGTHQYIAGYHGDDPIYAYDCMLTQTYYYCENYCVYCGAAESGSIHSEPGNVLHSIAHP